MNNSKDKQVPLAVSDDFKIIAHRTTYDKLKGCHYRELIGSLLYLSVCTIPNIALPVSELARYVP